MDVIHNIKTALVANFNPAVVEIIDESHKHLGHAGHGEFSHLAVRISASSFAGLTRVAREQAARKTVLEAAGKDIHAIRFEFV